VMLIVRQGKVGGGSSDRVPDTKKCGQ